MRRALALLAVASLLVGAAPAAGQPEEDVELVADGLSAPVALAFAPDGTLYYAELEAGIVRALDDDGPSEPVAQVPAARDQNAGLLGLAADPDDAGVLYAYYTAEDEDAPKGKVNRVVRLEDGEETVLLDDIPFAPLHNGGRLTVGPDGYLYVTYGDTQNQDAADDPTTLAGGLLRMTRDGEPAPDNPGNDWHPLVYAHGFRNTFGITITEDGDVYVSDNGGTEEVNLVEKGGRYGWPHCSGPCDVEGTTDPIAWWDESFGPTGITAHAGTLYVGDYVHGRVLTVDLDTRETGIFWQNPGGRVLDVTVGPDACLYVSDWESVKRIPLDDEPCAFHDLRNGSGSGEEEDETEEGDENEDAFAGPDDESQDENARSSPPDGDGDRRLPAPGALAVLAGLASAGLVTRARARSRGPR